MLTEQLLVAEAELSRLKAEEPPSVQPSPEEARGAMLLKVHHLFSLSSGNQVLFQSGSSPNFGRIGH